MPLRPDALKKLDLTLCGATMTPDSRWGVSGRIKTKGADAYTELTFETHDPDEILYAIGCAPTKSASLDHFMKSEPRSAKASQRRSSWKPGTDLLSATEWRKTWVLGKRGASRDEIWADGTRNMSYYFLDRGFAYRITAGRPRSRAIPTDTMIKFAPTIKMVLVK